MAQGLIIHPTTEMRIGSHFTFRFNVKSQPISALFHFFSYDEIAHFTSRFT